MRLVIDPGHGGKDPGALSLDGKYKESHITLDLSLQLRDYLKSHISNIILTRMDDSYPSLTARCQIANTFNADLFVSIHVNSADNPAATGIETLVYSKGSSTSHALAKQTQELLIARTKARDRGVKQRDDLTVLKKTNMPAILVETGFINNSKDLSLLLDKDYQHSIVSAIGDAILKFAPDRATA